MRRERAGVSLVEALVYCLLFSLLLSSLLSTYVVGARTFQMLVARQGIQSEMRRIDALLRRDLCLTDYRSVGTATRQAGTQRRDALAFVGLDDWRNAGNFDNYLRPAWNEYVLYAASHDDEQPGQLLRKEVSQTVPYPIPPTATELEGWATSPNVGSGLKLLSSSLVSFEVTLDPVEEKVQAHLVLRSGSSPSGDGQLRESEIIECYIDMKPENTWPSR